MAPQLRPTMAGYGSAPMRGSMESDRSSFDTTCGQRWGGGQGSEGRSLSQAVCVPQLPAPTQSALGCRLT